jgi:hypothetical protein
LKHYSTITYRLYIYIKKEKNLNKKIVYLCITPKEIERIRKGLFPWIISILDGIKHLHSEPINFFCCLDSPLDSHRYVCQLELRCFSLLHVADKINCRMSHHSPGLSIISSAFSVCGMEPPINCFAIPTRCCRTWFLLFKAGLLKDYRSRTVSTFLYR